MNEELRQTKEGYSFPAEAAEVKEAMSLQTVAGLLECSLSTVARLIRSVNGRPAALGSIKLMPGHKGCRRVTKSQLQKYLKKREIES